MKHQARLLHRARMVGDAELNLSKQRVALAAAVRKAADDGASTRAIADVIGLSHVQVSRMLARTAHDDGRRQ
jgi:hypothetical protein